MQQDAPSRTVPEYLTVATAAGRLSTTPTALRARCRRAPRVPVGTHVRADLGGGIYAVRLGRTWRVVFP